MTTLDRRIRELLATRSFLDGWELDLRVRKLLNEAVACGELADDDVDWRTMESRLAVLESWNRRVTAVTTKLSTVAQAVDRLHELLAHPQMWIEPPVPQRVKLFGPECDPLRRVVTCDHDSRYIGKLILPLDEQIDSDFAPCPYCLANPLAVGLHRRAAFWEAAEARDPLVLKGALEGALVNVSHNLVASSVGGEGRIGRALEELRKPWVDTSLAAAQAVISALEGWHNC